MENLASFGSKGAEKNNTNETLWLRVVESERTTAFLFLHKQESALITVKEGHWAEEEDTFSLRAALRAAELCYRWYKNNTEVLPDPVVKSWSTVIGSRSYRRESCGDLL